MSGSAIILEGVGKKYRIGAHSREPYLALRDVVMQRLRSLVRQVQTKERPAPESEIWALRDVSFEVRPGECLGIIGRNGAGKSTLLKLLGRITEPTTGRIRLRGRVASLLEVGTGFHFELTGRENIFLNGAILGMSRAEIRRKFDEIVAFAEVEKFIDTPVKHYSTGMYLRLAFAVAAHLDVEIMLVDEVLAVGDAAFQKKCLGKMEQLGSRGRTVLFVSHTLSAIQRLCQRVILVGGGRIIADGLPGPVIRQYLGSETTNPALRTWPDNEQAPGDEVVRLLSVRALDDQGQVADSYDIRRPIWIEIVYRQLVDEARPAASIHLINEQGITLLVSNDFNNRDWWQHQRQRGLVRCRCRIPGNFLAEGQFTVLATLCSYRPDHLHAAAFDAASFQVVDPSQGDGVRGPSATEWPGAVRPMLDWEVTLLEHDGKPRPAC